MNFISKAAPRHCRALSSERDDPDQRADAPPAGRVGANGIRNGLYSIHIRMLDGIDGGNTGVMMLQDGRIRGGDAYFDYIGAYSAENGRWKGEIVNREHTPSRASARCSAAMRSASASPAPMTVKARR